MNDKRLRQLAVELTHLETLYASALDAANIGVWEYDPDTKVFNWDSRMQNLIGVVESELSFDEFHKRTHPEDREILNTQIEHALKSNQINEFFLRIIRDTGEVALFGFRCRTIKIDFEQPPYEVLSGTCHVVPSSSICVRQPYCELKRAIDRKDTDTIAKYMKVFSERCSGC